MRRDGQILPDVILEHYLAALLEGEVLERVEGVLARSPADRERVRELRAASAAFLLKHPLGTLLARIARF